MLAQQITAAIGAARGGKELDHLSQTIWRALTAGAVGDDEAQTCAELLHARRMALKGPGKPQDGVSARPSLFQLRRPLRPVQVSESLQRRRRLAASGPMPPALAARFTTGELAVLRIVADECRDRGACDRSLAELAARAGCCRSLAKRALRVAARLGMISVELRPRKGRKHDTNVVRVIDREWLAWIARGARGAQRGVSKGIGGTNVAPTEKQVFKQEARVGAARFNTRWRRGGTGAAGRKRMR